MTPQERSDAIRAMAEEFGRISSVNVQEGDVFVFTHPKVLSLEAMERIRTAWRAAWADLPTAPKILILQEGMALSVIRGADLAEKDPAV